MRIVFAILFTLHGFVHLIGFVVPWQISTMEEMPYKTTVLNGLINLGNKGIRIYGVLWLLLATGFIILAITVLFLLPWWSTFCISLASVSMFFCLLSWPDTKFGVFINILLILFILYYVKSGRIAF